MIRLGRRRAVGRAAPVLLAVVAALGAGACGLPDEQEPRVVPGAELPFSLAGAPAGPAPTVPPGTDPAQVTVFLVQRGSNGELQLTSRVREIPANPFNLDAVMTNLFAGGVTESERIERLINLVPQAEFSITRTTFAPTGDTTGAAAGVGEQEGTAACASAGASAQIDLPEEFFDQFATQSAQRLALGQIVLTMLQFNLNVPLDRQIDSVQFTVGGRAKSVPTASADSGFVPVVRANSFAGLLEPQAQVVTGSDTGSTPCTTTPSS